MKALAIAGVNLRRLFRDRTAIFFVVIFPLMLILLLGVSFGGGFTPALGVVDREVGAFGEELVAKLQETEAVDVTRYSNEGDLVNAVERGRVEAGVVIPEGYDASLRNGDDVEIQFLGRPGSLAQQLRATVEAAVAEQSMRLRAARFAEGRGLLPLGDALDRYKPDTLVTDRPETWVTHWAKMGPIPSGGVCCPGNRRVRRKSEKSSWNGGRGGK